MAVLGLGLAALGRPGYMTLNHQEDVPSTDVLAMRDHAHAMLEAAYAAGVRHFDAARSYGRAEAFLQSWLETGQRSDVVISSKWGYRYTANWASQAAVHEVKELSLAQLRVQWAESKALLGDALRIYQMHSTTLESGALDNLPLLDGLAALRETGVAIGLSVTGPRQGEVIDAALGIERGGRRLFDSVQATWNVLEPSAGPALARAKASGVYTIVKEAVANGRLSHRGHLSGWLALASTVGLTPDALALSVALQQPFVDVVLSGATTLEQLRSNLKGSAAPLPDLDWGSVATSPDEYWAQRALLQWT